MLLSQTTSNLSTLSAPRHFPSTVTRAGIREATARLDSSSRSLTSASTRTPRPFRNSPLARLRHPQGRWCSHQGARGSLARSTTAHHGRHRRVREGSDSVPDATKVLPEPRPEERCSVASLFSMLESGDFIAERFTAGDTIAELARDYEPGL